jgi:anhydro-N-acetylmuramic acid kinase
MQKNSYTIVGVMSGTSLDGVDLALLHFHFDGKKWIFEIGVAETIAYDNQWIDQLKNGVNYSENQLSELNQDYTQLLGKIIFEFIEKQQLKNIDAVCSHGHTILHQPQNGFTLQIGNLPEIAAICQQKVVCDFRAQDVQLGGQGAPLVPIGDRLLFFEFDYCLNLGGFSNISFAEDGKRIAFDISPVNTVLNFYANQLGLDYDDRGKIAQSGNLNSALFDALNNLDFYQKSFPKSLGFEYVKEVVLPLMESYTMTTEDKMRTFVEHVAFQIANALPVKKGKLLITGGGAYNDFLIERLQFYAPEVTITIPEPKVLEYKEALIFGLLGVLKLRNEINVLSSVTGAIKDHSSGVIFSSPLTS